MFELGAVPARVIAHPANVAKRLLRSNAGFTGPQVIAEQSGCAYSGKATGGKTPLNVWELSSKREPVPRKGSLSVSQSLQGVVMKTPVPSALVLAGASPSGSEASAGQTRHFTQQFFADQLAELQNRPQGAVLKAAPAVCHPHSLGSWFGAQQEAEDTRCGSTPHGFNDALYACGSRPAAAIREMSQAKRGVGMI